MTIQKPRAVIASLQSLLDPVLNFHYHTKIFGNEDLLLEKLKTSQIKPDALFVPYSEKWRVFLEQHPHYCSSIIFHTQEEKELELTKELIRQKKAAGFIDGIYSPAEFVHKIDSVLQENNKTNLFAHPFFYNLHFDFSSSKVSVNDVFSDKLTGKEFQILYALYQSHGNVTPRASLIQFIWGKLKVGNKTLDVHLHNLRKKIKPLELQIEFLPGQGFHLLSRSGFDQMVTDFEISAVEKSLSA